MKKILVLVLMLGILLTSSFPVAASEMTNTPTDNSSLTEKELFYIINEMGLTSEEIPFFDKNTLRMLIDNNARKISNTAPKLYSLESEGQNTNDFTARALIKDQDISIFGVALEMTSDVPGSKKIYILGSFQWLVKPLLHFTDKMSVGYPVTNEFYLPTSGGSIRQHNNETCNLFGQNGWTCTSSTTPSNHDIGAGVAASFDLIGTANLTKGSFNQVVYTQKKSGKSNLLFRYGHRVLLGTVGVSVFPSIGLAVTPGTTTETLDYVTEISW
ncbi:hypothetical protein [Paenibacillus sp. KS-LC4]|uniref:hypothetical protein n=1 Tax=Paenibacillus sp. KS-LC4 TaxID=2979727 RepID=UPI0030CAD12F